MKEIWSYQNPVCVRFGRGCRRSLLNSIKEKSVLVVCTARGRKQIIKDPEISSLISHEKISWIDNISPNPDINLLQSIINEHAAGRYEMVIGFGGGSAMDAAKAVAVGISSFGIEHGLLELIANPDLHKSTDVIPCITVPTTSGTGSEVTPFATVWDYKNHRKMSLAGPAVFAHQTFVDPDLTDGICLSVTVETGLDAINQAVESIWNKNASRISMGYAVQSLELGLNALPKLARGDGGGIERSRMAEASLLAGLAISQTRTALCHSISYPITAHFGVPHGLACAFTMLPVLELNLRAEDGRFAWVERQLSMGPLTKVFGKLAKDLQIGSRVRKLVPDLGSLNALVPEMYTPERADNNLLEADPEIIINLLKQAWES